MTETICTICGRTLAPDCCMTICEVPSGMTVGRLMESIEDLPADTPIRIATGRGGPQLFTFGDAVLIDDDDGVPTAYIPELDAVGVASIRIATVLNWAGIDRGLRERP